MGLARRKIRAGKRINADTKRANRLIKELRENKEPSVPLSGAPVETQRWQAAMFDLQRELKAELDTRIVIVQTLLKQVDHKIEALSTLQANTVETDTSDASSHSRIKELMQRVSTHGRRSNWVFRSMK